MLKHCKGSLEELVVDQTRAWPTGWRSTGKRTKDPIWPSKVMFASLGELAKNVKADPKAAGADHKAPYDAFGNAVSIEKIRKLNFVLTQLFKKRRLWLKTQKYSYKSIC